MDLPVKNIKTLRDPYIFFKNDGTIISRQRNINDSGAALCKFSDDDRIVFTLNTERYIPFIHLGYRDVIVFGKNRPRIGATGREGRRKTAAEVMSPFPGRNEAAQEVHQ